MSFSLQKEEDFWKTKKQTENNWTKFWLKKAIFGPSSSATAYIYICVCIYIILYGYGYIYIYAVKLLTGPRLGVFNSYYLGHLIVTNWATSFSHYKNRGFRWFLVLSCQFVFFCFQLFANFLKIAFFKKRVQKLGFQFSVFEVWILKIIFFRFAKTL